MFWKWVPGRQGGSYEKMLLATASFPVGWDLYLLRYPTGSYIKEHRDVAPEGRHFRFNLVLWNPLKGGEFHCESRGIIFQWRRMILFRPDAATHSVSPIQAGSRYVLSVGVVA